MLHISNKQPFLCIVKEKRKKKVGSPALFFNIAHMGGAVHAEIASWHQPIGTMFLQLFIKTVIYMKYEKILNARSILERLTLIHLNLH